MAGLDDWDLVPYPVEESTGDPAAPETGVGPEPGAGAGAGAGAGIAGAAAAAAAADAAAVDAFTVPLLPSEALEVTLPFGVPLVTADRFSAAALRAAERLVGRAAPARPGQHAAVYQIRVPTDVVNTPGWRPLLQQLLEYYDFTAERGVVSRRVALASSLRRPPVLG